MSLISSCWYRKMSFSIKLSKVNHRHTFLILYQIPIRNVNEKFTQHSLITKCNKLDCCISNADLFEAFKKRILSFIRPMPNSIYNIRNPLGVKYLTRLRIGSSHLKEHKFKHNFQDSIDPMCSCSSCLKQRFIFFSIAQILILKDKPSLTKQLLHMRTF